MPIVPGNSLAMEMWTVTQCPVDMPGVKFAGRCHVIEAGGSRATDRVVTADTLEAIRALLPPFLHYFPRLPGDDPVIVESWM